MTFAKEPKISAAAGNPAEPFVFAPSEQRYIVPVLVTVGAGGASTRRPIELRALKALIDGVGRDAAQAEGVFAESLK